MRIGMVSEHASPLASIGEVDAGGQNVYVSALSRALVERGHTVDIYTRRDAATLPERVPLAAGLTVVHVPAGPPEAVPKDEMLPWMADFGAWMADDWIIQQWKSGQPTDIVHAHFWMSGLASIHATREVKRATGRHIPLVQTFHALGTVKRRMQGALDTSPPVRLEVERVLARQSNAVIATCRDEVVELKAAGAEPLYAPIVPCGVDVEHFRPAGPMDLPAGLPSIPAGNRLLCVGRLVERKGVGTAIASLTLLPEAHLVVAGGPAANDLDQDTQAIRLIRLATELGVAERVHLLGQVSRRQLPSLFRWSDVVVATPWYEPFGMVPLEAMACGRPVVASAVGGIVDTVQHGTTGVLVPPRDPKTLADALRQLLADPDRQQALGRAGRARAARSYDWATIARDVENIYTSLIPASQVTALAEEAM